MGARSTLFAKPVGDNPLPSINTEDTCPTSNFSDLFLVQNTRWHGNKISHSHNLSKFFLLAWFERSACPHLHTWNEHLVALQQVAEGEICWLVLGLLPEPVAVALYDQRHENQFVWVIYPRHVDETSVVVDLMDEFGSGFGKHGLSRRGLQTAGTERETLKASIWPRFGRAQRRNVFIETTAGDFQFVFSPRFPLCTKFAPVWVCACRHDVTSHDFELSVTHWTWRKSPSLW